MKLSSQIIQFSSKRNRVRLEDGFVRKYHKRTAAATYEAAKLQQLREAGLAVPKFISLREKVVEMEYIDGITLPELIEKWESKPNFDEQKFVAKEIVIWLSNFYDAVNSAGNGEIRGDINGRNFIFDGQKIWGIDFEEQIFGDTMTDIAMLAAFVLTYEPQNTQIKQKFAASIINYAADILKMDIEKLTIKQNEEIKKLLERRKNRL